MLSGIMLGEMHGTFVDRFLYAAGFVTGCAIVAAVLLGGAWFHSRLLLRKESRKVLDQLARQYRFERKAAEDDAAFRARIKRALYGRSTREAIEESVRATLESYGYRVDTLRSREPKPLDLVVEVTLKRRWLEKRKVVLAAHLEDAEHDVYLEGVLPAGVVVTVKSA